MSDTAPTFWGKFFPFLRRSKLTEDVKTPVSNQTPTATGQVSTEVALRLSVIWACVKLRSQVVASLPIHIKDSGGKLRKDHKVYSLLHRRPNQVQTAYAFWQTIGLHLDLYGNAFARINENMGVTSLNIIDPESVQLERNKYSLKYYVDDVEVPASKILHFKGMSLDGMLGLSPIVYLAETISAARASTDAASTAFNNGLKTGGFLYTGEVTLTDGQRTKMRNVLSEFSKPENAGKWMLMEAGMKPEAVKGENISAVDAQLLQHRQQLTLEVCSALGVHPSMIGHSVDGETWGGTLEQLNLQWLQYQLNPQLIGMEQELEFKLLSISEQNDLSIKHSVEGLLRADSKTRNEIMVNQTNNGLRSINEVRALDDMPEVDNGNIVVRQVQYQPLGTPLTSAGVANEPQD